MSDQPPSKPASWHQWKMQHGRWAAVLLPEWASEWIVYWSCNWEFVKVLELAGKFTLLFAAISWVSESGDRERARQDAIKAKHYRAWELINSAQNSPGDAGRRDALLDLSQDRVSLSGASLSRVILHDMMLSEADLSRADLTESDLSGACFRQAKLKFANFHKSNLVNSKMFMADLTGADLTDAELNWAKMNRANLFGAKLDRANLRKANLSEAYITRAILVGAILTEADLSNVEGLSEANLSGARLCRTIMPDGKVDSSSCPDPEEASAPVPPDLPDKDDCKPPRN